MHDVINVKDYIYQVYVSFAYGSGGGGGSDPINPGAQTGDILGILISALLVLFTLGFIAFYFVKLNKINKFSTSAAKIGALTSSLSKNKIIIALFVGLISIVIGASAFTVKAIADTNDGEELPAPPTALNVNAIMDKDSGTITIDDLYIFDSYCAEKNYFPVFDSFSLFSVNGVNSSKLGTWTVLVDDIELYSGPVNKQFELLFIPKAIGKCKISIHADGVSPEIFDQLEGKLGVNLQLNVPTLSPAEHFPESADVKVSLSGYIDNTVVSLSIPNKDAFNSYIGQFGWEEDTNPGYYIAPDVESFKTYDEVLQPWFDALDQGLLVNNTDYDFYKWYPDMNSKPYIVLSDVEFTPQWFPAEQEVSFTYKPGEESILTDYGKHVVNEHGWKAEEESTIGESNLIITGKISNRAKVSDINSVLNADCFVSDHANFAGWHDNAEFIFEICQWDQFYNIGEWTPIYVVMSGNVVDEQGAGIGDVCVTSESLVYTKSLQTDQAAQATGRQFTTTTDSCGNYYLLCQKGYPVIVKFGISAFSTTYNSVTAESLLIDKAEDKTLQTVVASEKATIYARAVFPAELNNSNGVKLDYGQAKFITTDAAGNTKVFYKYEIDSSYVNSFRIDTYKHAKGKLIFESPLYYGELEITDDSQFETEQPIDLNVKLKDPSFDADCIVSGIAYTYDSINEQFIPLKDQTIQFTLFDPFSKLRTMVSVTTDSEGAYLFKSWHSAVIEQVDCVSKGLEFRPMEPESMPLGTYTFNVYFGEEQNEVFINPEETE